MQLSVVIVNYKVPYYLLQCLDAVFKAIQSLQVEVIVVDNASEDESQQLVNRYFPAVIYLQNTQNEGFAKANNRAIRQAKGDYVLLLNPDTILPEDALVNILHFAQNAPQFGALGVRMVNGDGQFLPESKRSVPTVLNSLLKMLHVPGFVSNPYYYTPLDEKQWGEVPVLSGACMLLHKAVLGEVALLDERYFMYGEDIDLSYAITRAGFKNYYFPLTMVHYKGESTTYDARYMRHFYGAMQLFYQKYYGKGLVNSCLKILTACMVWLGKCKKTSPKPAYKGKTLVLSTQTHTYQQIIDAMQQHAGQCRVQIEHPTMHFTL